MQKVIPHIWYDNEVAEAVTFYVSLFKEEKILNRRIIENTPSGHAELIMFTLAGQEFQAISAGPYFPMNPAISFMVACHTKEEVDRLWQGFSEGGQALMPLGEYPFNAWYGWMKDQFGVSWQIVPRQMEELLYHGTSEENLRMTDAMLRIKKLDIAVLEKARIGE